MIIQRFTEFMITLPTAAAPARCLGPAARHRAAVRAQRIEQRRHHHHCAHRFWLDGRLPAGAGDGAQPARDGFHRGLAGVGHVGRAHHCAPHDPQLVGAHHRERDAGPGHRDHCRIGAEFPGLWRAAADGDVGQHVE